MIPFSPATVCFKLATVTLPVFFYPLNVLSQQKMKLLSLLFSERLSPRGRAGPHIWGLGFLI